MSPLRAKVLCEMRTSCDLHHAHPGLVGVEAVAVGRACPDHSPGDAEVEDPAERIVIRVQALNGYVLRPERSQPKPGVARRVDVVNEDVGCLEDINAEPEPGHAPAADGHALVILDRDPEVAGPVRAGADGPSPSPLIVCPLRSISTPFAPIRSPLFGQPSRSAFSLTSAFTVSPQAGRRAAARSAVNPKTAAAASKQRSIAGFHLTLRGTTLSEPMSSAPRGQLRQAGDTVTVNLSERLDR